MYISLLLHNSIKQLNTSFYGSSNITHRKADFTDCITCNEVLDANGQEPGIPLTAGNYCLLLLVN